MTPWKQLLLPIGLGLVAAWMNWITVTAKIRAESYVILGEDLARGERFSEANVQRIELPAKLGDLPQTAVPWKERALLYQRPVPRDLKQGDIVFWRDATPLPEELQLNADEVSLPIPLQGMDIVPVLVGQQVGFIVSERTESLTSGSGDSESAASHHQYVGPFRVLSLGEAVHSGLDSLSEGVGQYSQILNVAVRKDPHTNVIDEQARQLLTALNDKSRARVRMVLHAGHETVSGLVTTGEG